MDELKTFLLVWTVSEIAGVKKFDVDLNLGTNYKDAIKNQLKKNSRKGSSSYDMVAIEINKIKDILTNYGFKLVEPIGEEKEIKPKIEKHENVIEEEKV